MKKDHNFVPNRLVLADSCPLCGAGKPTYYVKGDTWQVKICRSCTNAWTCPAPEPVDYEAEDFHGRVTVSENSRHPITIADLPQQWRSSLLHQVASLKRALPKGGRVLEVGCGEGLLLRELAREGFRVSGVEPGILASERARGRGLPVITGYFPEVQVEAPVDAVILSHVLEHVAKPCEMLRAIDAILDGGLVLLVQTNWQGLLPRLLRKGWYAWVPEQHFWHFTPQGLETLFKPLGWQTHEVIYSSLVHTGLWHPLSVLAGRVPGLGDQFHILVRTPTGN